MLDAAAGIEPAAKPKAKGKARAKAAGKPKAAKGRGRGRGRGRWGFFSRMAVKIGFFLFRQSPIAFLYLSSSQPCQA